MRVYVSNTLSSTREKLYLAIQIHFLSFFSTDIYLVLSNGIMYTCIHISLNLINIYKNIMYLERQEAQGALSHSPEKHV